MMPELLVNARARGSWLRRQREAAGLTQEELADRSGLSVRAISNLERDRTRLPHPNSLRLLGRGLGLTEAATGQLVAAYRAGRYAEPALRVAAAKDAAPTRPQAGGAPAGLGGRVQVVPRQLPPAVARFAGRAAELAELDRWLESAAASQARGAAVIAAIGGMAGVGKTALALHWAHRVAGRFPDGQLYVNLRGYDPGRPPAEADETVRAFLRALGAAPGQIPAAPDDQTALYRSLLAGRRVLIVADNARNAAQVTPLLPGAGGSAVLVTSRCPLAGLAASAGARTLALDVLTEADAAELLAARLGADRVAAEPGAVAEIIQRCGRLPLALAIAAARADRPGWTLPGLADQLAQAGERLDLLALEDPAADVRAVFSWSYQQLSSDSAGMFRLLALHPGPELTAPGAASLCGLAAPRAPALLQELATAGLVSEHKPGRYTLHDLLRAYAAERAHADSTADERRTASTRMLHYYLHTAQAAASGLDTAPTDPAHPDAPEQATGSQEAMRWFDAEHKVLLAVMAQAARAGSDDYARQLAWTLAPFFERRGCSSQRRSYWQNLALCQQTALECSDRLDDPGGQARAHLYLSRALTHLGHTDSARTHLSQAATASQALRNSSVEAQIEAQIHIDFSRLWLRKRNLAESISCGLQALRLAEADADLDAMALACNMLGNCYAIDGDAEQALAFCHKALDFCAKRGNRFLEACATDSLGHVYSRLCDYREAAVSYQRAVTLFDGIGTRYPTAQSLRCLGESHQAAGERAAASQAWQQALTILDDLNHPDARLVRRKLVELRRATPGFRRASAS